MIRTPRLLLRPVRVDEDFAAMHAILSQPRNMAYWSTPPHDDEAQTREWMANMEAIEPALGEDFVIEFEGHVIGKAGFYRFPDIGYLIDPAYWGLGLGHEAVGAMIARGFAMHGLPRVTADVDPRNKASMRLLVRLGFAETHRQERTWLVGDMWCGSIYYALSRETWDQRTA